MNFNYLKPPKEAMLLKHKDEQIVYYVDGKIKRKIFYNVPFEDVELEQINKMNELIVNNQLELPEDWDKETTLKFCYAGDFDPVKTLQILKNHLKWRLDSQYNTLTQEGEEILKKGCIYCLGRDKQYRPLIFIQASKLSSDSVLKIFNNKIQSQIPRILNALCVLLNHVQKYMLTKYYVEKWRIIIDLNDVSLFRLPHQTIKGIVDVTQLNYVCSLEQLHLLNPPFILVAAWKLVEKLLHPETARKIQFCNDVNYLKEYIDDDQLQQKYSGTIPNLNIFWPIVNTYENNQKLQEVKIMVDSIHKNMGESNYLSMMESQYYTILTQKEIELSKPIGNRTCCKCVIM